MSIDPLYAPKLKLDRAKGHISDLNAEILAFLKRKPYCAVVETYHKPGRYALRFREQEALPVNIPLIIGDAVHNLRTTLDHLACALVHLAGGKTKGVYFPFAESDTALEATIKKRLIGRAGPKVVDVVRRLKPYKGGNLILRGIHDLDIADKHSIIVPVCRVAQCVDIGPSAGGAWDVIPLNFEMRAEDGDLLDVFPANPNVEVGQKFDLATEIEFDEHSPPFAGGGVAEILQRCEVEVDSIINRFDAMIRRGEIP